MRAIRIGVVCRPVQSARSVLRRVPNRIICQPRRFLSGGGAVPAVTRAVLTYQYANAASPTPASAASPSVGGDVDRSLVVVSDWPLPPPESHEITVRVHAASVNPIDLVMRTGYGSSVFEAARTSVNANADTSASANGGGSAFPFVLGRDVSGVVVAVGTGVWQFKVGDEIVAATYPFQDGTWAEYVNVPAPYAARKPPTLSHIDAASLAYAGLTAHAALFSRTAAVSKGSGDDGSTAAADVSPLEHVLTSVHTAITGLPTVTRGSKVLVHGGSGAVGSIAIQLLKTAGCEVYTTCSGDANVARCRALGADRVVDYQKEDFRSVLPQVDVVFDASNAPEESKLESNSMAVLKRRGHFVTLSGDLIKISDETSAAYTTQAGPVLEPVGAALRTVVAGVLTSAERMLNVAGSVVDNIQKERQKAADSASAAGAAGSAGADGATPPPPQPPFQSPFGAAATDMLRGLNGFQATTQNLNSVFGAVNSVLDGVRSVANATVAAATNAANAASTPGGNPADSVFYTSPAGTTTASVSAAAAAGASTDSTNAGTGASAGAGTASASASTNAYAPFAPLVGLSQGALRFAKKKSDHYFSPHSIHYSWGYFAPSSAALSHILALADSGALKPPPVTRVFGLSEIHAAVAAASNRATGSGAGGKSKSGGKVVLDLTK